MKDIVYDKDNPPSDATEANQRIEQLTLHRRRIDQQLSRTGRIGPNTDERQVRDQRQWRDAACKTRILLQEELNFLHLWVAKHEFETLLRTIGIPEEFFTEAGRAVPQAKYSRDKHPPTVDEGEERREYCVYMKKVLETALTALENASMERRNAGADFKDVYFNLRTRLIRHKSRYEEEIAFLKFWLKKEHVNVVIQEQGVGTPDAMLRALVATIKRLRANGVQLTPEEFRTFLAIDDWLQKNTAPQ